VIPRWEGGRYGKSPHADSGRTDAARRDQAPRWAMRRQGEAGAGAIWITGGVGTTGRRAGEGVRAGGVAIVAAAISRKSSRTGRARESESRRSPVFRQRPTVLNLKVKLGI